MLYLQLIPRDNRPPKLLSYNGSCNISYELTESLQKKNINHVRGKPLHPRTQGKIEGIIVR